MWLKNTLLLVISKNPSDVKKKDFVKVVDVLKISFFFMILRIIMIFIINRVL